MVRYRYITVCMHSLARLVVLRTAGHGILDSTCMVALVRPSRSWSGPDGDSAALSRNCATLRHWCAKAAKQRGTGTNKRVNRKCPRPYSYIFSPPRLPDPISDTSIQQPAISTQYSKTFHPFQLDQQQQWASCGPSNSAAGTAVC
jgi:hypothetical protein